MRIEEQVLAVAREWDEVLVGNDADQVGLFMTGTWVYVGPTGPVARAEILGWIADGTLAHQTMQVVSGVHVAPAGDTVVLTARKASTGSWAGMPYVADEWISQVWQKTSAGWRCAFSQKTDAGQTQ
jgi:ketosteroid isomerase-like protein